VKPSVREGNGVFDVSVDESHQKIRWLSFLYALGWGVLKVITPLILPAFLVLIAFVISHRVDATSYQQHVNFMTYMGLLLAALPVINVFRNKHDPETENTDLLSDEYGWTQLLQTPERRAEYLRRYVSLSMAFVATMIYTHVYVLRDWNAQTAEDQSHILIIYTVAFIAFLFFGCLYLCGTYRPEDPSKIPDALQGQKVFAPLPRGFVLSLLGFLIAVLPIILPRAVWGQFLTQF
ncbi:MAG: hypothetical protein HRT81_14365, partial [Henriciella sp.]|nr:hypothetical protein [Henriciella sp.]